MYSELKLQQVCFTNHWNYYPELRRRLCCINNNSHNSLKGSFNKGIGVIAGASDMFYLQESGHVTWLEFKIPGGKQSEKQKEWQQICHNLGHDYRVIYSENEFWNAVGLENPVNIAA